MLEGERQQSAGQICRWVTRAKVTEVDHPYEGLILVDHVARVEVTVEPARRSTPRRRLAGSLPLVEKSPEIDLAFEVAGPPFEVNRALSEGHAAPLAGGRVGRCVHVKFPQKGSHC